MVIKKTFFLLLIAFFLFSGCGTKSYLSVNSPDAGADNEENTIDISNVYKSARCECGINTAITLINGSHEDYRSYHNECVHSFFSNNTPKEKELTDWLSYAFIMAEIYHDTLAAYDFVQIIDYLKMENAYLFSDKIIKYLEMVSKSNYDKVSFFAARKLYDIYDEGKYGISRDKGKAKYYDSLSFSIMRAVKQ